MNNTIRDALSGTTKAIATAILITGSTSGNAQKILEKNYVGDGPLGDPVCQLILNNGKIVTQLCSYKGNDHRYYTEMRPGGMQYEEGGMKYTPPGQIQMGPTYNPHTRKLEVTPPRISAGGYSYKPGGYSYKQAKTVQCSDTIKYSQFNGVPIGIHTQCSE